MNRHEATASPSRGDLVQVKTAFGTYVEKRAVTGPIEGDSFTVVRVCSEDEWTASLAAGREPQSTPWPRDDVLVLAPAQL